MFPLTVEYDFSNSTNDVTDFEQWTFVLKRFSTAFSPSLPSTPYLPSSKQIFIRDSLPKRVDTLTRFDGYLNGPPPGFPRRLRAILLRFSRYTAYFTRLAISIFVFLSPRREERERERERERTRESAGWYRLRWEGLIFPHFKQTPVGSREGSSLITPPSRVEINFNETLLLSLNYVLTVEISIRKIDHWVKKFKWMLWIFQIVMYFIAYRPVIAIFCYA